MANNYYLSLLRDKVKELDKVLKEIKDADYPLNYKKYLISGYIITLDSILEIGIGDLHTPELDELTSLIYYTRQKAVHYGYFNGLHNIEETANKIINLTENNFEHEQQYYEKILNFQYNKNCSNIWIKSSKNIEEDKYFYKFKSQDGSKVLCVPINKIFKLTAKNKDKTDSYIIDTSFPMGLYTYENDSLGGFKEIYDKDIKQFFKENFLVSAEDNNQHSLVMRDIISSFVRDPLNSIQITEYSSNNQFCRNTIEVIKEFIVDNSMYYGYTKSYYLIKDKYSLAKMVQIDYSKLKGNLRKNISQYINEKDVFFALMTLKRCNHYYDILSKNEHDDDFKPEILSPILIQMFEIGPKHFSSKFINAHSDLKKCYNNLLRYRQIFSHYILLEDTYKDAIVQFRNEFINFANLLDSLDLSVVKNSMKEEYETCNIIERDKSDFFNYKHEQYLRINNGTYIGKKINYSSHKPNSKSLIAILPGPQSSANMLYYKRDINGFLTPEYTIDEKKGTKVYTNLHTKPLKNTKEAKIDFNLTNLFKAYFDLHSLKDDSNIYIIFTPSDTNGNTAHYDDLDTLILRCFNQGYIPAELLQRTKLDTTQLSKGIISLTDMKDNPIATIVNRQKAGIDLNSKKDDKRFFSRIDDITHDFSRRRHTK